MYRASTSGTQIFHTNEDVVELDGLPVGPSKDVWAGIRRRETVLV